MGVSLVFADCFDAMAASSPDGLTRGQPCVPESYGNRNVMPVRSRSTVAWLAVPRVLPLRGAGPGTSSTRSSTHNAVPKTHVANQDAENR